MPFKKTAPVTQATSDISVSIGLGIVLIFFILSGYSSYSNTRTLRENASDVAHTYDVITGLNDITDLLKDAETGQRGYILTGNDSYLEPYRTAVMQVQQRLAHIKNITQDNPLQQQALRKLAPHVQAKLDEMQQTINLRSEKGVDAAVAVVLTDRGKREMDFARGIINAMQQEEKRLRQLRLAETDNAYRVALWGGIIASIFGIALAVIVGSLMRRASIVRRRQEWLQSGQLGISDSVAGENSIEKLGEQILTFLARYFDAHAGAFFVREGNRYHRVATYGVPAGSNVPDHFRIGEGLLGQAAKEQRAIEVRDVPEGYLTVGSALGRSSPKHLLIAPADADGEVNAVLELGFIHPLNPLAITLLQQISKTIGIAVRSASYRSELQNLLEETQRQTEELQTQSEELKVNNEELEEQGRALKESQARLEQQQAELEQTNSQLEEQTQMLESQRDEVTQAKRSLEVKASELEQASQYKSDFLANMSHELRTPLNSSLILAKLLADNATGNLTEEQVKYAQTIESAGNDLLALINDILDLSKIEAGHMEIRPESLTLTRLVSDLTRVFEPVASEKSLTFKTDITTECPATIETDRLRLEQILKNLLSNAFKFTQKGSVTLRISNDKAGKISFAVTDTGIGISEEQQNSIFDAFRQADGTVSRRYGGTGLGLSISRELARLLGGGLMLESTAGTGSTFTLIIPAAYDANAAQTPAPSAPAASKKPAQSKPAPAPATVTYTKRIEDDRERLAGNRRTILVVEDDEPFARIMYDLAHELGFQCLISTTAEEALTIARQYVPSALVLDVGLPDNSGLYVLDRLKRDTRTRHIPVHVISASDYAQTALSLGAVGYMLKPVKREELADALKQLETTLTKRVRQVLIVEDDPVQRDSVRKLLGTENVETVAVGSAAECLKRLRHETFDCMVLDLTLPDTSGYSLLETLSKEEGYSFPPVIVYTGRDLSSEEEQKLRRYSKSIIIKGAKSPERLLDEVTLFLHQVVSELPAEQQRMIESVRNRDAMLENRRVLIVEDDIRNVYALTSILEPQGVQLSIARHGKEALKILEETLEHPEQSIDLVLMDVMMPEMDGLTATRAIRQRAEWKKLPIIMLTAKAMRDDQERCLEAGANDYMAKPLDVEKLLSLVRVWMPR